MAKTAFIFFNAIPILVMEACIPFVRNDYALTAIFAVIIIVSFSIYQEKKEGKIFLFGFIVMIISEYLFVHTGVEVFTRNSLFGFMPLWLPLLWGYCFVAIKRAVAVLGM